MEGQRFTVRNSVLGFAGTVRCGEKTKGLAKCFMATLKTGETVWLGGKRHNLFNCYYLGELKVSV